MDEIRLSVIYPMPLNPTLDQEIRAYAEHYGFKFLGSGSDGYTRDVEFHAASEILERDSLLTLLSHLLSKSLIVKFYCSRRNPLLSQTSKG